MEGFRGRHLVSSKEELSSGMLENDQSWNTAVPNVWTTHGFKSMTPPLDSWLSDASAASSALSLAGGLPSDGTSTTSGSHQFDIGGRMISDNFCATRSVDALSQQRQDATSHVPFLTCTNFGEQNMPINMIGFQQNSLHNNATAYETVQLDETYPLTSYPKDTANMLGYRDDGFNLNISAMAMECSYDNMAMPQAAVADCGHSKIQPLGCQTVDHGSEQRNTVISNLDTSKYSRNFDRESMVLQSRTAAEGCSATISGSHVTTSHPLWGRADMNVPHPGQHTPGDVASLGNNLDGHSQFHYDDGTYDCMLLNNIQQKSLNDPSHVFRTASEIHFDSGNVRSGVAVTPSLRSPVTNQLQPVVYTQAKLNQHPCSSSQVYHRRVRMTSPASIRQPMQMDCNFSDLSSAAASATGSVFPGITGLAGEGRASMRLCTSIQKSDATPLHKRNVHPPTGMGDAISRKTPRNTYAVNISQARFVTPASDQYLISPQISQLPPNSSTGPGCARSSIPTTKHEQVVPPQFQSAVSLPEIPIHVRQPSSSVRSPMTQQPIAAPSSSTRRRPISSLHTYIPESIATGPGFVRSSIPTIKQEQIVPPHFQNAVSPLLKIPMHVRQRASSVRSRMTQQPIAAPLSSTHRRPISSLQVSIPPNIPGPRGKYSPSAAPIPERSKISTAICFKSQRGLDQPLGYKCGICKRDVSYAQEGPITVPTAPLPVAVLPCGHTFHDPCLQAITPKEQEQDPPCIPCAMGEA